MVQRSNLTVDLYGEVRNGLCDLNADVALGMDYWITRKPASERKLNSQREIWNRNQVGACANNLWRFPNLDKTRTVLMLGNQEMAKLMENLNGHSAIKLHISRMDD